MTARSFAQNGEDIVALQIFERIGIERPSYLDVGAYHPFDLSNTALMYQRGSRGINVEANPHLIAAFLEHRPEDVTICAAVGPASGRAPFYLDRQSLLFPGDASIEVEVVTVSEIVDAHGGVFPDFLTIDIEGMDLSVLQSIEYARHAPKVICAEVGTDVSGRYVDIEAPLREFLAPFGYRPYGRVDNNLFLVRF